MTIILKQNTGLHHELIKQLVETILIHVRAKKIIIYGSRARGNFRQTSDIDLAVESYEDSNNDLSILNEILNEDIPTLLKCEVINLKKVGAKIRNEVLLEGIVIYEKISAN